MTDIAIITIVGTISTDPIIKKVGNTNKPLEVLNFKLDRNHTFGIKSDTKEKEKTDGYFIDYMSKDINELVRVFKKGDRMLVNGELFLHLMSNGKIIPVVRAKYLSSLSPSSSNAISRSNLSIEEENELKW